MVVASRTKPGFRRAHRAELIGDVVIFEERQLGRDCRIAAIAELGIRFLQAAEANGRDGGDDNQQRRQQEQQQRDADQVQQVAEPPAERRRPLRRQREASGVHVRVNTLAQVTCESAAAAGPSASRHPLSMCRSSASRSAASSRTR